MTSVRPGQPVTIRVDAFPNLRLKGHVDSIQRGTGSQFALLPPENATGNFVKVVQRVPVKITFDDPGEAIKWISPGMSVETRITFGTAPRWLGFLN
jgi:membrane fusion protein (multidrug efflux system)